MVNGFNGYLLFSQDLSLKDNTVNWIDSDENILFAIGVSTSVDNILNEAEIVFLSNLAK